MFDIFKPKAKPDIAPIKSQPVKTQITGGSGWGGTGGGRRNRDLQRTPEGAAQAVAINVPAMAATRKRARTIAQTDWRIVNHAGDEIANRDNPEDNLLANALVNHGLGNNGTSVFELWQASLCIIGEAYIEFTRDSLVGSFVTGVQFVNPLSMRPVIKDGVLVGFVYTAGYNEEFFEKEDIVFDRYAYDFRHDFKGISPLENAMDSINIDRNLQHMILAQFRNMARPDAIITPSSDRAMPAQRFELLKEQFKQQLQGVDNTGRTLLLPEGLNVDTIDAMSMEHHTDVLQMLSHRVYGAYGVPAAIAGDTENARYQNSPENEKIFHATVVEELQHHQDVVNTTIVPVFNPDREYRLEFDTSPYLHISDTEVAKTELIKSQVEAGLMSIADAQNQLGIDAKTELEDLFIVDGVPIPLDKIRTYWENKLIVAPSVFNVQEITGEPLPQPQSPGQVIPTEDGVVPLEEAGDIAEPDLEKAWSIELAQTELKQWRRFTKKKSKRSFKPVYLRGDISDAIQLELDAGNASAAMWGLAEDAITFKAIQATRIDFEDTFEDLLTSARSGDIDRRTWRNRAKTALQRGINQAYRDGLQDGGIVIDDEEPLDDDDKIEVNRILSEQSIHLTALGKVLFKEDGISDDTAAVKPAQWFDHSVYPAYLAGLGSADKNGLYEWVQDKGKDNCKDCTRMDGQRHRMRDYLKRGILPKSAGSYELVCSLGDCGCLLAKARGKARGRWL